MALRCYLLVSFAKLRSPIVFRIRGYFSATLSPESRLITWASQRALMIDFIAKHISTKSRQSFQDTPLTFFRSDYRPELHIYTHEQEFDAIPNFCSSFNFHTSKHIVCQEFMDLCDEISNSLSGVVGNVVIILLLTSSLPVDGITSEVIGYSCTGKMFANGGAYEDNRRYIFRQVTDQISAVTQFKIYHYGEIPDTVFGLSQCAFRDTNDANEACYKYAYDGPHPEYFDEAVLKLLFNLTNNISLGFATGLSPNSSGISDAALTNSFMVYAWVGCSRGLLSDCGRCLAERIADMESNFFGNAPAQMWSGSCALSYKVSYPTNNGPRPGRCSRPSLDGGLATRPPPLPPNISVNPVSPPARKITGPNFALPYSFLLFPLFYVRYFFFLSTHTKWIYSP
eukprot:Gb_13721 [translate_table: standard]